MVQDGSSLEELSEVFKSSRESFLGDPVWWVRYSHIDVNRVHDRTSREYRNVKCIWLEVIAFCLFACLFISDIYLVIQTQPSNRLTDIHGRFWNFTENSSDFWLWASDELVEKLYGSSDGSAPVAEVGAPVVDTYLNNAFTVSNTPSVVPNTDMVLVGSVRLRQLRVEHSDCLNSFNYYNVASFCASEYESGKNDDQSAFFDPDSDPMYLEPAFKFNPDIVGNRITSKSTGIVYPPNGYIYDLPIDRIDAKAALSDLASSNWISAQTSAVIVEVNTFHPISDTFFVDRFLWEFSTANSVISAHSTIAVPAASVYLTWSSSSLSVILFSVDLLTLLFFLTAAFWYFYVIFSSSLPRLRKFLWFYLESALLILIVALVVCRGILYSETSSVVGKSISLFGNPTSFFPISKFSKMQSAVISLQAVVMVLLFIRGFKLLYLAPERTFGGQILNMMKKNFKNALTVVFLMAFALIGFALALHLHLGYSESSYSSLEESFTQVALSLTGVINFNAEWITEARNGLSFVAFLTIWWIFVVYLLLIPLLVAGAAWDTYNASSNVSGTSGSVLWAWWSTCRHREQILVESPDTEDGVDIDALPVVVKKRILTRRRCLREKIEANFEIEADDFDEMDDFVTIDELRKVMKEDPLMVNILGGSDARTVVEKIKQQDPLDDVLAIKMHSAGNKGVEFGVQMDANIRKVSDELSMMIEIARKKFDKDIGPLSTSVNTLQQAVQAISLRAQRPAQRRSSKTAFN